MCGAFPRNKGNSELRAPTAMYSSICNTARSTQSSPSYSGLAPEYIETPRPVARRNSVPDLSQEWPVSENQYFPYQALPRENLTQNYPTPSPPLHQDSSWMGPYPFTESPSPSHQSAYTAGEEPDTWDDDSRERFRWDYSNNEYPPQLFYSGFPQTGRRHAEREQAAIIASMGISGAAKSSFIKKESGKWHGIESYTATVNPYDSTEESLGLRRNHDGNVNTVKDDLREFLAKQQEKEERRLDVERNELHEMRMSELHDKHTRAMKKMDEEMRKIDNRIAMLERRVWQRPRKNIQSANVHQRNGATQQRHKITRHQKKIVRRARQAAVQQSTPLHASIARTYTTDPGPPCFTSERDWSCVQS